MIKFIILNILLFIKKLLNKYSKISGMIDIVWLFITLD